MTIRILKWMIARSRGLGIVLTVAILMLSNSQSMAQETVIFSENFAGSSSESLGGKTPTTGDGVWQVPDVNDAIKADGSFAGTGQKWLNWTPSSGYVYELKVTINQTSGTWAGLCFKPAGTPPNGNPIWTGFGPTGVGTMLNVDVSWPNVGGIGANGSGTYMIRLDTTAANWKTSYFFNGVQKGTTHTWTTNTSIDGVGIISYDNTETSIGSFSNFELKSQLPGITIAYSNGGGGVYETYSSVVSATDIANVGSSTLSSLTQTTGSAIFGSSVSVLNDGIVFDGVGDRGDTSKSFTPSDGSQVVFEFNSARKVSEINTFAMSGSGQTRSAQNYKLEYRSGSIWTTLFGSLNTSAAGNLDTGNTSTRVNIDFSGFLGGSLANVDALRFTFYNVGGDETLYREIDVLAVEVDPYASWATDNAGGQAANLDYDNDGVPNGIEYFMNAAPGFTANPSLVGGTVTWPNGGNMPSSGYGSQFVVETSTDLVNWIDVLVSDPNLSNNPGSVSYTLTGADRLFVRFKVLLD